MPRSMILNRLFLVITDTFVKLTVMKVKIVEYSVARSPGTYIVHISHYCQAFLLE